MSEFHTSTDRRCKTSQLEETILAELGTLGLPLIPQVKRKSWVFDAGVQGTKILIEINGDYWHSLPHAKERDARKAEWAAAHGYTIITIWEGAYLEDPAGQLQRVVDLVEQARAAASDRSDTDGPIPSYTFDDWRDDFITALAQHGNIRQACIDGHISRSNAYHRRENDGEFAAAWDEALENFCDLLEGTYTRRAIEQSDRAIEFLLRANRPTKYGERTRVEHSGPDGGPIAVSTPALEAAAQELAAWRRQQAEQLAALTPMEPRA